MPHSTKPPRNPPWANEHFLRIAFQLLFIGAIILVASALYVNMLRGLDSLGLRSGWKFLGNEAGFGISEGIAYSPSDTYMQAFTVGLVNTLKVSAIGVILATMLGVLMGIGRLSSNWLLCKLAWMYVEVFRNTPLLVQLIFWYVIMLRLPFARESLHVGDVVFINQRGVFIPALVGANKVIIILVSSLAVAVIVQQILGRCQTSDRGPWAALMVGFLTFALAATIGWWIMPGPQIGWDVPALKGFNFQGGLHFSPELSALLLGLVAFSGAFIAEIVRGGIQAVSRGQGEAARALGLTPAQTLRLVILPQAIRIIVPPMGSQYLNLMKNSSLAIAIGYPDLYNVSNTILNQTGQPIAIFAMVMATYLAIGLIMSLLLNWYNRRLQLV